MFCLVGFVVFWLVVGCCVVMGFVGCVVGIGVYGVFYDGGIVLFYCFYFSFVGFF